MLNSLNAHLQTVLNVFVLFSLFTLTVLTFFIALGVCNLLPIKFLNFSKTYIKLFCFFCSITISGLILLLKLFSQNMYSVTLTVMQMQPIPIHINHNEQLFDIFWHNLHIVSSVKIYFNSYILSFLLLFAFLYPIIFWLIGYDYNTNKLQMYLYMLFVFFLSFLLLLVDNILIFYFIYEILLILIFRIIYLSSNARGGIEGSLFYAAWALVGSILVGLGFMGVIILSNSISFLELRGCNKLTANEIYYLYLLFFFGFGTKLSIWPFWYWLPRAHVEVSTGISIFLSCILIKLAYFALVKVQLSLSSEISLNICILVGILCTIDIVFRFINLKDLKAIIAYSSVLHTNLLIILIHIDHFKIVSYSLLYVWGHSLATACLFLCVNLIESIYGSRHIFNVTGLWYTSPTTAYLTLWSLLFFLEFPCTLFFWGEIWLWVVLLSKFFLLGTIVLFLSNVIFISIFFKVWWGVLYGTPSASSKTINLVYFKKIKWLIIFLIILQFILGFQPSLITSSVFIY